MSTIKIFGIDFGKVGDDVTIATMTDGRTFMGFPLIVDPAMEPDSYEFRDSKTGKVLAVGSLTHGNIMHESRKNSRTGFVHPRMYLK